MAWPTRVYVHLLLSIVVSGAVLLVAIEIWQSALRMPSKILLAFIMFNAQLDLIIEHLQCRSKYLKDQIKRWYQ